MSWTPREPLDPFGDRRREQQRLPLGRGLLQDLLDVLLETHGEHLVALVEDGAADAVEAQRSAPQVIEHAARRPADDLAAGVQLLDLPAHRRAAVDRDHGDAAVGADLAQLGGDLQRQLARRQQHDGLHEPVLGRDDVVGEGDAEGGRLARAGARLHHQVAAGRHQRQRRRLNRHRLGEAHLLDGAHHVGVEAQLGEAHRGDRRGGRLGGCGVARAGGRRRGGGRNLECGVVVGHHGFISPESRRGGRGSDRAAAPFPYRN